MGLKLPDICLTGEEKPRKNLTQETCPDRGLNPGPLGDKRACYHLLHSGGLKENVLAKIIHSPWNSKRSYNVFELLQNIFECFISKSNSHGHFEIHILK